MQQTLLGFGLIPEFIGRLPVISTLDELTEDELVRILTLIEENFQKIFSNLDKITKDFAANISVIYEHFFNYLPQFMANSLKGVGLIFELSEIQLSALYDLGIELGYFYQFGIFAYIMAAIRRQSQKQIVKEHL